MVVGCFRAAEQGIKARMDPSFVEGVEFLEVEIHYVPARWDADRLGEMFMKINPALDAEALAQAFRARIFPQLRILKGPDARELVSTKTVN